MSANAKRGIKIRGRRTDNCRNTPGQEEYAIPHSTCPSMVKEPMDHCLNARQSARLNIRRGLTYCLGNKASTGGAVEDRI